MKYTERIALEQYNFLEIEADTYEELVMMAEEVKKSPQYKSRLHNPSATSPMFPEGDTVQTGFICETCGTKMVYKEGFSKKSGKKWKAFFCPNAEKGQPGHDPKWVD